MSMLLCLFLGFSVVLSEEIQVLPFWISSVTVVTVFSHI